MNMFVSGLSNHGLLSRTSGSLDVVISSDIMCEPISDVSFNLDECSEIWSCNTGDKNGLIVLKRSC